jgi:hypothetical protein
MTRVLSRRLAEAEELLEEAESWSEDEIQSLPKLYQRKAKEYRRLLQQGE